VAAHSVNRPAEHMSSRKLIARRVRVDPQQLRDESFDLKTLHNDFAGSPVTTLGVPR